jgi:hypothetical protein
MVVEKYPVSLSEGFYSLSFIYDNSCRFVTNDERGLFFNIPGHNITGAYSACLYPDKNVSIAGFGNRHVLNTDVMKVIELSYVHIL